MAEEPTRKLAVLLHADVVGSITVIQLDETLRTKGPDVNTLLI